MFFFNLFYLICKSSNIIIIVFLHYELFESGVFFSRSNLKSGTHFSIEPVVRNAKRQMTDWMFAASNFRRAFAQLRVFSLCACAANLLTTLQTVVHQMHWISLRLLAKHFSRLCISMVRRLKLKKNTHKVKQRKAKQKKEEEEQYELSSIDQFESHTSHKLVGEKRSVASCKLKIQAAQVSSLIDGAPLLFFIFFLFLFLRLLPVFDLDWVVSKRWVQHGHKFTDIQISKQRRRRR